MRAARRLGGESRPDAPLAKFRIPLASALPLFPDRRPQSAPEPLVKLFQYRGRLAEAEVASPSAQVCREFLRSLRHADPSCPARKFSNPSLEPQDRFRRNPPSRFFAAREAEPQKLPVFRPSYCTLRLIHLELELRGKKPSDALHHSLAGPLAANVNITVVRISQVSVSTSL